MVIKAESNHWISQMIDVHACGCWFVRAWPLSRGSAADFQQLASLLDVAVGPVFGGRVWMDWLMYACKPIIHLSNSNGISRNRGEDTSMLDGDTSLCSHFSLIGVFEGDFFANRTLLRDFVKSELVAPTNSGSNSG